MYCYPVTNNYITYEPNVSLEYTRLDQLSPKTYLYPSSYSSEQIFQTTNDEGEERFFFLTGLLAGGILGGIAGSAIGGRPPCCGYGYGGYGYPPPMPPVPYPYQQMPPTYAPSPYPYPQQSYAPPNPSQTPYPYPVPFQSQQQQQPIQYSQNYYLNQQ